MKTVDVINTVNEKINYYMNMGISSLNEYEKNSKKINIFNIFYYKRKYLKQAKKYFFIAGKFTKLNMELNSLGDKELSKEEVDKSMDLILKY